MLPRLSRGLSAFQNFAAYGVVPSPLASRGRARLNEVPLLQPQITRPLLRFSAESNQPIQNEGKDSESGASQIDLDSSDSDLLVAPLLQSKADEAASAFLDLFQKRFPGHGNKSRKIIALILSFLPNLISINRADLLRPLLEGLKARGVLIYPLDYSRVLKAVCDANLRDPSFALFEVMPSIVSRRRPIDYLVLIEAISRNENWGGYASAKSIFDRMASEGFSEPDKLTSIYTKLISLASAAGKSRDVLKLFRDMSFSKIPMSADTFKQLLPPTLRHTFFSKEDLDLIIREHKANPVGDHLAIGTQLIRFLVHTRNFQVANQIYLDLKHRRLRISRETYLDLIDLAIMDKQFDTVESLLKEMISKVPAPFVDLKAVKFLRRFLERGVGEAASFLLGLFLANGLELTPHQVRATMRLFADYKMFDVALKLGESSLYKFGGDARLNIANVILFVLLDKNDPEAVIRKSHQIFRLFQFRPSAYTYDAILLAFCRLGQLERAKETFTKMVPEGVRPTYYHYTILIDAAIAKSDYVETFAIFQSMKTQGVAPDVLLYNKLIVFLGKMNHHEEGVKLFEEMKASGKSPDAETVEIFLFRYVTSSSADQGPLPRFAKNLLVELGEIALQLKSIDPAAHNQILILLAGGGHLAEARSYLGSMRKMRLKPLPATTEFLARAKVDSKFVTVK